MVLCLALVVRMGERRDFVEIHKLIISIFPNAAARVDGGDGFFVAELDGKIVGFAHFSEDGKRILLNGFGVVGEARNMGAGGAILDELVKYAEKGGRCVYLKSKLNNPALKLYCEKGFCFRRLAGETLTMVRKAAN